MLSIATAQTFQPNYEEANVGNYRLPEVLQTDKGKKITTSRKWEKSMRPKILAKFAEHVYGKFPGRTKDMHFTINSVDSTALGGKATRKQVTIFFTKAADSPSMDVLLYLPNQVKEPVPVFIGLNFYGNHSIQTDPGIQLSERWMNNNEPYKVVNNRATEGSRGAQASRWPVEEILARGYGLATAYYGDLEPDHTEGWKTGIRTTLQEELTIKPEEWGAISAWAWGLSRIMDYLETDKQVNAKQVAITGHSRIGKAALWAAANDQRFAMVISNDSGEGGTALARRNYGETLERINTSFPHWFVSKYKEYNTNVDQLPVDQHMLLALMAPRPLYVASAEDDQWADPRGEFLSAKHAEPVYELYGKKGLGTEQMPAIEQPVGEYIRYHIRTGKHDITLYDWQQFLTFADKHFKQVAKAINQ
ncbi:acetylxylan esterase [Rhodocytophaga aerolata]|uniref:Acetylxylan esterase n=1 Tax=Rhodocytophaga aerolata TaxID=455078 RepID=A0ABT8R8R8_9BACT|nr:acetylxylan esterase [Rhodocytophaga aerolata]MDO1447598.1 acetylxylan esterase [Rhodocytophaga aerolata]